MFSQHLERRLSLWRSGQISNLFDKASGIQQHLPVRALGVKNRSSRDPSDTVFPNLVFKGKINSAMRYLSEDSSRGVLDINDQPVENNSKTVRDLLLEKLPDGKIPPPGARMDGEPIPINPTAFERLTPEVIKADVPKVLRACLAVISTSV